MLDKPYRIGNDDDRNYISRIMKGFEQYVHDAARKKGWKFDTVSDLARVMRVPGTLNYKGDTPISCEGIEASGIRHPIGTFELYAEYAPVPAVVSEPVDIDPAMIGNAQRIIDNCAFMRYCRDEVAVLSEPNWHAMISNFALTADGNDAVHELSEPYFGYSHEETEYKFRSAVQQKKPVSCRYICEKLGFSCPENGCGVKSPIAYYVDGTGYEDDRLFGVYATEWYRVRKEPFFSPSTRNCYRSILNKHILPAFGMRKLRAIQPIELQKYVNGFAGQSKTQINMICSTLENIFASAVQDKILSRNPAQGLRKPEAKQAEEKRALSDAERAKMAELFREHRHGLYLAVMYCTGMRQGEVRSLKWADFDWDADLIHVQRDIDFANKSAEGKLKTKAADRYIPIAGELRSLLSKHRGMPDALLFPGKNGKPLLASTAKRMWLELMRDCDLVEAVPEGEKDYYTAGDILGQYRPMITPHAMRHNFITMCWENGMDIMLTMKLVGHSDYQTTRNIYTHLSEKHLQQAKAEMEAMFSKKLHNSKNEEKLFKI